MRYYTIEKHKFHVENLLGCLGKQFDVLIFFLVKIGKMSNSNVFIILAGLAILVLTLRSNIEVASIFAKIHVFIKGTGSLIIVSEKDSFVLFCSFMWL